MPRGNAGSSVRSGDDSGNHFANPHSHIPKLGSPIRPDARTIGRDATGPASAGDLSRRSAIAVQDLFTRDVGPTDLFGLENRCHESTPPTTKFLTLGGCAPNGAPGETRGRIPTGVGVEGCSLHRTLGNDDEDDGTAARDGRLRPGRRDDLARDGPFTSLGGDPQRRRYGLRKPGEGIAC